MKKDLFLALAACLLAGSAFSQATAYSTVQFYHDLNSNCALDPGEPLIYNPPAQGQLTYLNNSSSNSVSGATVSSCPVNLWLFNPATPATNTLAINFYPNTTGWSFNSSCQPFTNLSFSSTANTAINYIPFQTVKAMGPVSYKIGTTTYNGNNTNNVFPFCVNMGDSVEMSFQYFNIYTCNDTMSPRQYSIAIDGVQYELFHKTGLWTWSSTAGNNGKGYISEYYMPTGCQPTFKMKMPNLSGVGSHTLSITSSQLYNHSSAMINYTCLINVVPCTNLTGKFYNDCNSNCTMDATDPGLGTGVSGVIYNQAANLLLHFAPNANGNFSLMVPAATAFSVAHFPVSLNSSIPVFTACSTNTLSFPAAAAAANLLFGYKTFNYIDPSISIYRSSGGTTNPGNMVRYSVFTNTFSSIFNCTPNSNNAGTIKVRIPSFMSYVGMSTGAAPSVISATSGDTLVWNVNNVNQHTLLTFSVSISNTISLQTPFSLVAWLKATTDLFLPNNTSTVTGTVGVPYDPNDKRAFAAGMKENGDVPNTTTEFTYIIRFQNLGTAPAVNVKTLDTMDVNFDLSSLQVLNSSFPVVVQKDMNSRLVGFYFEGINLPPAVSDEVGSIGSVTYRIKVKNGTPTGTVLKNRAHNYFDFTEPVATNQTQNKLVASVGLSEMDRLSAASVMPNPFTDHLSVTSGYLITTVKVYNQLGQLMTDAAVKGNKTELDLTALPPGLYLLNVELSTGDVISKKVVKH